MAKKITDTKVKKIEGKAPEKISAGEAYKIERDAKAAKSYRPWAASRILGGVGAHRMMKSSGYLAASDEWDLDYRNRSQKLDSSSAVR